MRNLTANEVGEVSGGVGMGVVVSFALAIVAIDAGLLGGMWAMGISRVSIGSSGGGVTGGGTTGGGGSGGSGGGRGDGDS